MPCQNSHAVLRSHSLQENVLLDHKDRCKICDFGLAHRYDRDAQGKVIRKTLHEVRAPISWSHAFHAPPPAWISSSPTRPHTAIALPVGVRLQILRCSRCAGWGRVRRGGNRRLVVWNLPVWHAGRLLPARWRHHERLALCACVPSCHPGPLAHAHRFCVLWPSMSAVVRGSQPHRRNALAQPEQALHRLRCADACLAEGAPATYGRTG